MEAIITAAIGAAVKLVELIFLGAKAPNLTQEDIDQELERINEKERQLIAKWWSIVR
jgi:hypothetical protein